MGARLKQMLKENRLVKVFGLGQICHPKIIEILGLEGGYDAVWLDQEHAGLTIEQIEYCARSARLAGLDSFVRLAPTDYATVMRPMEAGAGGIMAAQVRSAQQAADVIRWSKFYPLGLRGVNGSGIDGRYGTMAPLEYMEKANAETFVAIQIEHAEAVAEVEKIAALPEVDILFIGPADLGQSMGLVGKSDHPDLWAAIERTAKAAHQAGIHWAILPPNPTYARRCLDLGCKMLSLGLDMWTIQRGIRSFKADFGI
jgi:4-hydroxy-2-oxoheptanedioate aldolase